MSLLWQSLLIAVTAVIVAVIIPAYRQPSLPIPEIFGTTAPGFENVREVFRRNYEDGWDVSEGGSAFSAYKDGEKVVDLWAGYADFEARRLWREDTMSVIFSATKAIGALCVAMLADRGFVDFTKPVAEYWPEFARNGKEKITVEQLLEHEAGLYIFNTTVTFDLLRDHEKMDSILAELTPLWEPGSRHGYHTLTIGPLVDALVRRIDPQKRTIGQFFEDEVRKPFGVDIYVGVPLELSYRTARCLPVDGTLAHLWYAVRNHYFVARCLLAPIWDQPLSFHKSLLDCGGVVCEFQRWADPEIRRIELASGSGFATASGLAKLFSILANGGEAGNKTLLSKEIIDEYSNDKRGLTPDLVMYDMLMRWKYGMLIIPQENGGNLFGSIGLGGQHAYADPTNGISYGFVSRYMSPTGLNSDPRFINLQNSVLSSVKKLQQ